VRTMEGRRSQRQGPVPRPARARVCALNTEDVSRKMRYCSFTVAFSFICDKYCPIID